MRKYNFLAGIAGTAVECLNIVTIAGIPVGLSATFIKLALIVC